MENTISEIINEIVDNISSTTIVEEPEAYTYLFNDSPEEFIRLINEVVQIYINSGARSSKKVDKLHGYIKSVIDRYLTINSLKDYTVVLEHNVPSLNSSGKKCCDIVVLKKGSPFLVFPVKFIMTNYNQNKNNSWENLTGEMMHLKWANSGLIIIPVNIIFNLTPYLESNKTIKKMEHIEYNNSFKIYEVLTEKGITFDNMNFIMDVTHRVQIGDKYGVGPCINGFSLDTPFKSLWGLLDRIIKKNIMSIVGSGELSRLEFEIENDF